MSGQRVAYDPFGWSAAAFECKWFAPYQGSNIMKLTIHLPGIATYLLLWPEDGRMKKEDIRRVYDGSLFYEIAARREKQKSVLLNGHQ
jgi:peroxygenase